ncbi:ABC transporter ATP-binding protein [Natronospora cellulosivora (SeqCode)]
MPARNRYFEDENIENVDPHIIRRLLTYLKPYKLNVFLALFLMFIARGAQLTGPYLTMLAIDHYMPESNVRGLLIVAFAFLLLNLVSSICIKYRVLITNKTGHGVIKTLRKEIFTHIQNLSFSYFDSLPAGKLITRVMNNVNTLENMLKNGAIDLIIDFFTLFIILFIMFNMHFRLSIIALSVTPILISIIFMMKNKIRVRWQNVEKKGSNVNAYIHESLTGMKITQSFVREEKNSNIFHELLDSYKQNWMKAVMLTHSVFPTVMIINTLSAILLYTVGIRYLSMGIVTVGTLIALSQYIWRFWEPVINLSNFYNQILIANSAAERVFQVIDTEPDIKDKKNAIELPDIKGKVEFKNVTFSYEEGVKILKNMSFIIEPGETIALVGATGAGKSTIINLMTRFYEIDKGEILLDDINIQDVTIETLRKQVGVMMQDSFIFSGTISGNIRYGNLDASDEKIIEAAKTVYADKFIKEMENGYETELNERGSRLSVGQRQLLSFARTILSDPKILILDEATSSIDTQTELLVQKATDAVLEGRTSFVIAHRLSTIRNADRIFVIDQGEIIETGSHHELLNKKGAYYKLYKAQYSRVV